VEDDKKYMRFLASCFAMTGLLQGAPNEFSMEHMADIAVRCGDALIEELEKDPEDGIAAVAKRVRRKPASERK